MGTHSSRPANRATCCAIAWSVLMASVIGDAGGQSGDGGASPQQGGDTAAQQRHPPTSQPPDRIGPKHRARHPELPPGFVIKKLDNSPPGMPREFALFVPKAYGPHREWPVLLFLHGSGECGAGTYENIRVGLGRQFTRPEFKDYPFLTLFPQVSGMWFRGPQEDFVLRALDQVLAEYRTDRQRIYLSGISMGGFGTWEIAMRHPDRFAAIVPVCGGAIEPDLLSNISGLPVWAFHGRRDKRVPVSMTRDLIEALRRNGDEPRYTEYPEGLHACWDDAYTGMDLWKWLLEQRRRERPMKIAYRLPAEHVTMPWAVWWFRFDAVDPAERIVTVACNAADDGRVAVVTRGVSGATLLAEQMPYEAGREIRVIWNGHEAFAGKLAGDIRLPSGASAPRGP
ncbi:MAG: prolyl oligopeptidase family serine peptidase [Phycisphaerae bacterium]|nr:prolyl oligopeptidase family serine peptidase [Phycisphaerae bacterium]NUQ48238.1 prolyl oligopeptidase family serine peptidase [Phycisphaerae bacterium]